MGDTERDWVTLRGQVSGLLLALRAAEIEEGVPLPVPLTHGETLRSWTAAMRAPDQDDREALDLLGWAARTLGRSVCRWRALGVRDVAATVLLREAAAHGCEPELLVAQVARVQGVLTAPDPVSAALVWEALADTDSDSDTPTDTDPAAA
ncbi:hypothetical protein [Actinomycetospora straminea]|uniref:ANTAR domain-containing protein n=1 Tax=Actinomycetospora straminea TaxID=663607 RepID=A0ABP9EFU0_9PSEU|nr:hypothetical protein [Actinomycetospora straminea]MDD7933368.1 hypothetical protein [Actinomycetospora straminea]